MLRAPIRTGRSRFEASFTLPKNSHVNVDPDLLEYNRRCNFMFEVNDANIFLQFGHSANPNLIHNAPFCTFSSCE